MERHTMWMPKQEKMCPSAHLHQQNHQVESNVYSNVPDWQPHSDNQTLKTSENHCSDEFRGDNSNNFIPFDCQHQQINFDPDVHPTSFAHSPLIDDAASSNSTCHYDNHILNAVALDADYMNYNDFIQCFNQLTLKSTNDIQQNAPNYDHTDHRYFYYDGDNSDSRRYIFEDIPSEILKLVDEVITKGENLEQHFHAIDALAFKPKFPFSTTTDRELESDTDSGNGTIQTENGSCSSQTTVDIFTPPELYLQTNLSKNENLRESQSTKLPDKTVLPPPEFLGDLSSLSYYLQPGKCNHPITCENETETENVYEELPPPPEFSEYEKNGNSSKPSYVRVEIRGKKFAKKGLLKSNVHLDKIPGTYLSQSCIDLSQISPKRRVTFADEIGHVDLEAAPGTCSDNDESSVKNQAARKSKTRSVNFSPKPKPFSALKNLFRKHKIVDENQNDKKKKVAVQQQQQQATNLSNNPEFPKNNEDPFGCEDFDDFSSDEDDVMKPRGLANNSSLVSNSEFLVAFDSLDKPGPQMLKGIEFQHSNNLVTSNRDSSMVKTFTEDENKPSTTKLLAKTSYHDDSKKKKETPKLLAGKFHKKNSCEDNVEIRRHTNFNFLHARKSHPTTITSLYENQFTPTKLSKNPLTNLKLKIRKFRSKSGNENINLSDLSESEKTKLKSSTMPNTRNKTSSKDFAYGAESERYSGTYSDEEYDSLRLPAEEIYVNQSSIPQKKQRKHQQKHPSASRSSYYQQSPMLRKGQEVYANMSSSSQLLTTWRHSAVPPSVSDSGSAFPSGSAGSTVELSNKNQSSVFETFKGVGRPLTWREDETESNDLRDAPSSVLTSKPFRLGVPYIEKTADVINKNFEEDLKYQYTLPEPVFADQDFVGAVENSPTSFVYANDENNSSLKKSDAEISLPVPVVPYPGKNNKDESILLFSDKLRESSQTTSLYSETKRDTYITDNGDEKSFNDIPAPCQYSKEIRSAITKLPASENTTNIHLNETNKNLPPHKKELKTNYHESPTKKPPLKPKPRSQNVPAEVLSDTGKLNPLQKTTVNNQILNIFDDDALERELLSYNSSTDFNYKKALNQCDRLSRHLRLILKMTAQDNVDSDAQPTTTKSVGKLAEDSLENLKNLSLFLVSTAKSLLIAATDSKCDFGSKVAESIHNMAKFSLEAKTFIRLTGAKSGSTRMMSQFICVIDLFELTITAAEELSANERNDYDAKLKELLGLANDLAKELAALYSLIDSIFC